MSSSSAAGPPALLRGPPPGRSRRRRARADARAGAQALLSGSGQANLTHEGEPRRVPRPVRRPRPVPPPRAACLSEHGPGGRGSRGAAVPLEARPDGKVFPALAHRRRRARSPARRLPRERRPDRLRRPCADCRAGRERLRRPDGRRDLEVRRRRARDGRGVVPGNGLDRGRLPARPRARSHGRGTASGAGPGRARAVCVRRPRRCLRSVKQASRSSATAGRSRPGGGDLLFTHTGPLRPGVLDLSRDIRPGDLLIVTFVPGVTAEALDARLVRLCSDRGAARLTDRARAARACPSGCSDACSPRPGSRRRRPGRGWTGTGAAASPGSSAASRSRSRASAASRSRWRPRAASHSRR